VHPRTYPLLRWAVVPEEDALDARLDGLIVQQGQQDSSSDIAQRQGPNHGYGAFLRLFACAYPGYTNPNTPNHHCRPCRSCTVCESKSGVYGLGFRV